MKTIKTDSPIVRAVLTEAQEIERGQLLADVLCLHRAKDVRGRYHTQWGSKTPLGLFRTVARILEDGK